MMMWMMGLNKKATDHQRVINTSRAHRSSFPDKQSVKSSCAENTFSREKNKKKKL